MPVTCTADNLATLAACFVGLSPAQKEAVKIYLLAVQAGVDPDAEELAILAKCLEGLMPTQQAAIQTYLLCQIANGGGPVVDCILITTPEANAGDIGITLTLNAVIETVTWNSSQTADGIYILGNSALTSFSAPSFSIITPGVTAAGISFTANPLLTTISFPLWQIVNSVPVLITLNAALASLSFPSLTTAISASLSITDNPLLTSFSFPAFVPQDGLTCIMSGNAYDAASVNHVLAIFAAVVGITGCTIDLSGGTMAAPTGQGIIDKGILIAGVNTVTTN